MENRLPLLRRCLLSLLFSTFLFASYVDAQLDFTFSYNGPDTLYVDESCTAILDWGAPGSISAECNNPGCVIITFDVFSITGGYMEGDLVPAGEKVLITYFVVDNEGNDAFFGFDIDIIDTLPPMFDSTSLPMDLNVVCLEQVPDPPAIDDIVATDNCPQASAPPVDVVITYLGQSDILPPCEAGVFTRTWLATDEYGNTSEYVQTVTVGADTDPPIITGFPSSLTEACDTADYLAWLFAQRAAFLAMDDGCGIDTIYDDAPLMFMSSCDSVTVTFTAEDGCDLMATTQATYIVTDDEGPVITPPSVTDITLECTDQPADPLTIIDTWADSLIASDNCDSIIWTNDFVDLTGGCGGTTGTATVTYTAADRCGHSAFVAINFTVEDNTPPSIDTPPTDETVTCDGMGNSTELAAWLNDLAGAEASDVCTATGDITFGFQLNGNTVSIAQIQDSLDTQLQTSCGASIAVTFTFTDLCGNPNSDEASFNVTDMLPPVWDTDPEMFEVECDGTVDPGGAIAAWLMANGNGVATDACGSVSYSHNYTGLSDQCGETGTATVTFTASDNCGNSLDRMAMVSIVDNTPPSWDTDPTNLDLDCDAGVDHMPAIDAWLIANGNGIATDNCSTPVIITNDYIGLTGGCGETGSATVIFTATDACGRISTRTATVSINDNTPPVWTEDPDDLVLNCDGTTDPTLAIADWLNNDGNGTAMDACSGAAIITHDYTGLTNGCTGNTNTGTATVTFTATDSCGNMDTRTKMVSVVDNTDPVWDTNPDDLLLNCDGVTDITAAINAWLAANGNGAASDVCGVVMITNDYTGASPGCTPMDAVEVIFTATDDCDNAVDRTASITIIDSDDPTIDTPADDITVNCDNPLISFADWLETHGGAEASDGCYTIDNSDGSTDWSANPMAPVAGCGGEFSTLVEFTVTDNCGNLAITTATYTVEDTTPPTFTTLPTGVNENCGGADQASLDTWISDFAGAVIEDGCGSTSFLNFDYATSGGASNTNVLFGNTAQYPQVTSNDCNWSVAVTFRIVDACGLENEASATFFINDFFAPIFVNIPGDVTVDCDGIPAVPGVTVTDNCDLVVVPTMTADTVPGTCPVLQVITRTWMATDACGNDAMDSQVITVEDRNDPVLVGVPAAAVGTCDNIPMMATVTATDICDDNPVVMSSETDDRPNDGSCGDYNYTITRVWTATDACGNTSSSSQQIVISDTQAPTFTGPASISLNCDQGTDPTVAGQPTNLMDQCDPNPSINFTDVTTSSGCGNSFTFVRTWIATDACGNASPSFEQTITVTDLLAPTFTTEAQPMEMDCGNDAAAETAFLTWLTNNGSAAAMDNCSMTGDLTWFAAVPGSYDINNPLTFPGTAPGTLDAGVCPSPMMGLIRFETVDFVVYDECNNAVSSQATFSITDDSAPVFDFCPADITVAADAGTCEASVLLALPVISDACGSTSGNVMVNANAVISSTTPGNTQIPVDPVTLSFTGLPTPTVSGVAPITLDIDLNGIDGEQQTEYFLILGEDGSSLGQTNNSASQCGNSSTSVTIPAALFNAWTTDGVLTITLMPNIPTGQTGDFAINDICPAGDPNGGGSTVAASLSYSTSIPSNLIVEYSIDGGSRVVWNPVSPISFVFPEGNSNITYYATDCAGNENSCSYTVTVEDQEAPSISCPADIVLGLNPMDDCTAGVSATLPLPSGIMDNCAYPDFSQTQPFNLADALLTFTFDPNYQNYIADDKAFNFVATSANAVGGNVILTVKVEGDVEDSDEFFTILGEDNSVLGVTEASQGYVTFTPGSCPTVHPVVVATIPLPTATYNAWAGDGVVTITAVSNTTFSLPAPGGPSDGINPSCTTFVAGSPNGQNDGNSNITIQLDVNTATPYYYTTGETVTPNTNMLPPVIAPTLLFNAGETEVFYVVGDLSGNEDTCSFKVTIEDNIPPVANCQATTIFVNPSGVVTYTLDPSEIDLGSSDNCGIVDYSVSPSSFDCSQAGTSVTVTLTVTDGAGNTDDCTAIVAIESEAPVPSYSIGLCGNDTLYLFANPPAAPGGTIYTYLWSGPNGFVSTLENPFIPNVDSDNSGTYSVQIEGVTGCTALGTVEVLITDTPNTPIISANSNMLCTTDDLTLTTQQYSGGIVSYHWYAGIFPGGTFIATTVIPTHTIFAPLAAVTNTYYVIVEVDGCSSDASFFTTVEVTDTPVATTNDALLQLCEGESFTLGTMTSGTGYTYSWAGPNGFVSSQANPPTFTNPTTLQAGVYVLTVSANGCPSNPVTTLVNITAQPAQPVISSPGLVCAGDSVIFTTNITGADLYGWTAPDFTLYTTTTNTFTLPAAALTDAGNWTVFININGCNSVVSLPNVLFVESPVNVIATNNGPVCEGSMLQLSSNTVPGGSYVWNGPNGGIWLSQNPVVNAVAGIYSVTVTASSGCTNVATTTVIVDPVPVIDLINNSATPCVSGVEDITLSVDVTPADPGSYTYLWTGPNGYSSISNTAVIPNATEDDNGAYIVIVTSNEGCSSAPMQTLVNVTTAPITPAITGDLVYCEGEDVLLITTGYSGANVVFNWTTPNGPQTTTIPSLIINNSNPLDSGTYQVFVTVDGCPSNISPEFEIDVNPIPTTPVIVTNAVVCIGATIELETAFIPGATYVWNGPAGFSAGVFNPVIFNATVNNEGAYTVQVIVDGCPSATSVPVNVQVNEATAASTILNNGPICISDPGATLILTVSNSTATPGAVYTWFDALTNTIISGPSVSLTATITDFLNYGEGIFDFYVVAEVNGCASPSSIPTSVVMNAIPNAGAFAGDPITVCNASSVALEAQDPTVGSGVWTQVSGPVANISNPSLATTIVGGLQSNEVYIFEWTLSNGACTNYSSDQVTVTVNGVSESADAGLNIDACNTTTVNLAATASTLGATGIWSQSVSQQAEGVVIVNPNDPATLVTGLEPGEVYEFTWTLSNPGCGEFSSASVIVSVEENNVAAFAGIDFETCANGIIQLGADDPDFGTGTWSTTATGLTIIEPNNPNTIVQGLVDAGFYIFTWTLDNGACGITTDEVVVDFETGPVAFDDGFAVPFAGTIDVNVKINDEIDEPFTITMGDAPEHGQLSMIAPGEYVYAADPTYAGVDNFTYVLCSEACPDVCTTAKVNLLIGEDALCNVPSIFTPNNDLVNDYFIIPCLALEDFPNNVVSIFNQWGDEVFRGAPYQNDWTGTYKGEDLPVGTYYFIVDFGQGQQPKSGFLVLER